MKPSNRKNKFVHGACERKSVQEKLAQVGRGQQRSVVLQRFQV